jgi:GT2 family glycosyltransferase
MDHSITVVLNTYKRLDLLEKQIESLLKQTIIPKEIFIWNNSSMPLDSNKFVHEKIPIIVFNSSMNFGVWSRFSVALNSESRFVAVMDDDTIPG